MTRFLFAMPLVFLAGCGSVTLPAAVKTSDGRSLVGTTTAAMSGGTFSVATADRKLTCSGTYDALDTSPTISVPVTCSDGRYAKAIVTRSPDGRSGYGNAVLSDGTIAVVAFGNRAGDVLATTPMPATATPSGTTAVEATPTTTTSGDPVYASTSHGGGGTSSGGSYTGNCPTPDSLDSAGRRCGARSAASRPGGYDGYSASTMPSYSSGSTYVRGHYRKGRWVSGYYRRR